MAMPDVRPIPVSLRPLLLAAFVTPTPWLVAQTPAWRVEELAHQDQLGRSIAWLDDRDGDGVRDFAVASGSGLAADLAGVEIRSGANGSLLVQIVSSLARDGFGAVIAAVDDIDGDGQDDLAISSPARPDPTGGFGGYGELEIFSTASGLLLRGHAQNSGVSVGNRVTRTADLDGDGVADYLSSGAAFDYKATLFSGASGAVIRIHTSATTWGDYGYSLAALGDVDGDGVDDYAVGDATDGSPGRFGPTDVFSGATGALIHSLSLYASLGCLGGFSVAPAGDLDLDGRADLLVGGVASTLAEGFVAAVSGASGAVLWSTIAAPGSSQLFGTSSLALADDLDGDGDADVVAASIAESTLYLFDAATGAPTGSIALAAPCRFSLDASRDHDGDGVRDLFVGQPNGDDASQAAGAGRATLLSGASHATLLEVRGTAWWPRLGASAVVIEDRDGDSTREIAFGVPGGLGDTLGFVRIASGAHGGELARFDSGTAGDEFGAALAVVADQDGDAIADLLVGAPAGAGGGRVDLVSGASGARLNSFNPPAGALRYGSAVATALDGAGKWRVAIGDPDFTTGGTKVGRVELFELATGLLIRAINGLGGDGSRFGHAIAAIPDTNGDAVPDWAIGSENELGFLHGSVDLVSGSDGLRRWRAIGSKSGDHVGWSVSDVGDVNGDGTPDVLTGNPHSSSFGNDGMVTARSGVNGARLFRLVGPGKSNEGFGSALRRLGDVDRDGFDDFAVGVPGRPSPDLLTAEIGGVDLYSGRSAFVLKRFRGAGSEYGRYGAQLGQPGLGGDSRVDRDRTPDLVAGGVVDQPYQYLASHLELRRLSAALLEVEPPSAAAGATVTATLRGGPTGAAAGLFLVDFGGAPVGQFAAIGALDATSSFAVVDVVPPGLAGLDATLRGYLVGWTGKLEESADESLAFE